MTGMPASVAFLRPGRTALLSWASRSRTLAPFEMRVSMSVSCCSLLRLASASMYLPPPASTVFWMFGLSVAAQRGCWKLFQETPTVHPAAPPPPPPLAPGDAGELQAANSTTATDISPPNRRMDILDPPPTHGNLGWSNAGPPARSNAAALGYHPLKPPFAMFKMVRRSPGRRAPRGVRAMPPDRPATARRPAQLHQGAERSRREMPGRRGRALGERGVLAGRALPRSDRRHRDGSGRTTHRGRRVAG